MESDEKKASSGISLADLPDAPPVEAASESLIQQKISTLKARRALEKELRSDPRGQRLKHLSDEQKLLAMTKRYQFGKKQISWGLVALYALPVLLKHLQVVPQIMQLIDPRDAYNIVGAVALRMLAQGQGILEYAELLVAALFIVKLPLRWRRDFFVVAFDGIEVPVEVKPRPGVPEARAFVRWAAMEQVRLVDAPLVSFLELRTGSGEILGQLLWNLSHNDKKLFHQILRLLVAEQHPLRHWVEQELA
ncbi:MAG: hypothetical protein ACLGG7_11135 [Bacteriovoracia bacterium]